MHSSILESELSKKSAKGAMSNEILKYNFLIGFGNKLAKQDPYNLASLYIYKHALGEMEDLREKLASRQNVINHSQWNSFCNSHDYDKSCNLLKAVMKGCESTFENSFNTILPMVQNRYGPQVAEGIQQNLGHGPYARINSKIIAH